MIAQNNYNFPGLVKESKQLLRELNLPDITQEEIAKTWSKAQWKAKVKQAIKEMCEDRLRKDLKEFKKTRDGLLPNEKFNKKQYMSSMTLNDTRVKFKLRSHMFDVKWNYRNDPNSRR